MSPMVGVMESKVRNGQNKPDNKSSDVTGFDFVRILCRFFLCVLQYSSWKGPL